MIKEEEIRGRILDYLLKNPDAGGTLEDISKWWLESEKVDQAVDEVAKVLRVMLEKGLLKKVNIGKGELAYKLAKEV